MTPIPTPKPRPRPTAAPRVAVVKSDPAKFGRVDADGSVYCGDRKIGEWKAGTPEEGLAHYGKRFDDLATEVELLEVRLRSHPGEAVQIRKAATALKQTLPTATVIGDIDALDKRLATIIDSSDDAEAAAKAAKAKRREEAIARKEALAAEAEEIAANSTEWKAAGDRLRAILDEWKTIRGIERSTDDALWKRYSKARDSFNHRRGSHFAELDRTRAAARKTKEALVARAEEIKDSTEFNETAREFRDLMREWKQAGRAPRDIDQKLWNAFKAAQDHFFDARNAVNAERDKEFADNAAAKQALLDEYSPLIDPEQGLEAARTKLRELQEKWETIGFVPRDRVREFEDKIAAIERKVTDAADAQWRRTDPAAQARAAQFIAKVEQFNEAAAAAEAKGDSAKAADLKAQAAQWQEWADAAMNAVEHR